MAQGVVATRIMIGLTLIAGLIGLVIADHVMGRGLCLAAVVPLLLVAGMREYGILSAGAGAPVATARLMLFGGALSLLPLFEYELGFPGALALEPVVFLGFFFALVLPALSSPPSKELFTGMSASVFGMVYVGLLGSYALKLRYLPGEGLGEAALLYTIAVSKGTDIFAFFIGRFFGKAKLIPHISPGKTVAGFWGGMLGALVITAAFCAWTPLGWVLPWRLMPAFAIVVGLVVIAGDLVESQIKRSAQIKDSATLLPTFGGILDVIDSILAAAPVVYFGLQAVERLRGWSL